MVQSVCSYESHNCNLDRPSSASQIEIEIIGYCGRKVCNVRRGKRYYVSRDGFRCFCCMMWGMEMYDILKSIVNERS